MEWENKQRMDQNMVSNQGTMNQPFYIPPPMNGGPGNYDGSPMGGNAPSSYSGYPQYQGM